MTAFKIRFGWALAVILLAAFLLRLSTVGFGLPALLDPDEPLFLLKGYELLDRGSLNPMWFGHPGTLTIYTVAVVECVVAVFGLLTGQFNSLNDFAQAVLADPSLVVLPARLVFVVYAVIAVYLTAKIARQLVSDWAALLAAALVALNSLHIIWSQVIRTDIQSSVFVLAGVYFALEATKTGRRRDFALLGVMTGLAMAVKWPGGVALIAGVGAAIYRARISGERRLLLNRFALLAATTIFTLVIVSPYLILDWRQVASDLSGEVARGHLGHDSVGLVGNVMFYASLLLSTMGAPAFALIFPGVLVLASRGDTRLTLLPVLLIQMFLISAQVQIWSRWLTPSIPLFAICAAVGADWALARLNGPAIRNRAHGLRLLVVALLLVGPAVSTAHHLDARNNDTRSAAAGWARRNIPKDASVVVEHLALDLQATNWKILFPMGSAGCQDGRALLSPKTSYGQVQSQRRGSIVDIGNVAPQLLSTCRADYLILTYYDAYANDRVKYAVEWRNYQQLSSGYEAIALFQPKAFESGGPTVRVMKHTVRD
nr:glycosyltransferase family 39 protein [uncultured Sphingomonas sp.]